MWITRVVAVPKLFQGSRTGMIKVNELGLIGRKGVSLLEVVIATVIIIVLSIPIFRVFSSSNQMFDVLRRKSMANQLAHKVIEDISALSYEGLFEKIPVHDDFRAVVPNSGMELSPYFQSMDGRNKGLPEKFFPNLVRDLKDFRCRVFMKQALDLQSVKKFQMAHVEVKYATKEGKFKVVKMQTIISIIPQLR